LSTLPRVRPPLDPLFRPAALATGAFRAGATARTALALGRVTSAAGGDIIIDMARQVLRADFPALGERTAFHLPDEKDKRRGQAAASLPALR
jgi:hypothetical protein